MQVPDWAPDRVYLVGDYIDRPWNEERMTPRDVLYVRHDLAGADTPEIAQHDTNASEEHPEDSRAPDRAATGRAGHWTGTEEAQANYLIATMTGRTPEEVKEPLSRLLHELRYRHERNDLRIHACGNCGASCCTYVGWGKPGEDGTIAEPCDHGGHTCGHCGGRIEPWTP